VKDANQLAASIAFLYDRPELSKRMGEAGREFVGERHSQEQHFLALGNIYQKLARTTFLTPESGPVATRSAILKSQNVPAPREPLRNCIYRGPRRSREI